MCKHYDEPLSVEHRHFVPSVRHDNCVLCIAEEGPLTQAEIGRYLGVTKERVCQVEKRALRKLRLAMGPDALETLLDDHKPCMPTKAVFFRSTHPTAYLDAYTVYRGDGSTNWRNRCVLK